jgi:hypothetical protein
MSNEKHLSPAEKWQAARAVYTWHLRPPFEQEFDHSHWWQGKPNSEIDPIASLYELARRHPLIGKMRHKFRHAKWYGQEWSEPRERADQERLASLAYDDLGQEPQAIHCLCLLGLKSWPKLHWQYQEYWKDSAGNLKGLECRNEVMVCISISSLALGLAHSIKASKFISEGKCKTSKEVPSVTSEELDKAIKEAALGYHRQGHLLIAVAPDLKQSDAEFLLARTYKQHQTLHPVNKKRARFENWLSAIATFEDDEVLKRQVESKVFTLYKRIMDGLDEDLALKQV